MDTNNKPTPTTLDEVVLKWAKVCRENDCFKIEDEIKQACLEYAATVQAELASCKIQYNAVHDACCRRIVEVEKLKELLGAAAKYVPANAFFGDIHNKPLDEVRLTTQITAAMQKGKE